MLFMEENLSHHEQNQYVCGWVLVDEAENNWRIQANVEHHANY